MYTHVDTYLHDIKFTNIAKLIRIPFRHNVQDILITRNHGNVKVF